MNSDDLDFDPRPFEVMTAPIVHPAERARVFRDVLDAPPPGTLEEQQALAAIDQARHADRNPPSLKQRRRRARAHWGDRDHALGR